MTRVEIQSGTDAALPESLAGRFQVCDHGETRGWCVGSSAAPAEDDASSEPRRG